MNWVFKIKFWTFNLFLHIPPVTVFFLFIFKVYLQNQSNIKQYVIGNYMVRYWSTVDGMWCYTYYHLGVNKECCRETRNHIFQSLKLFHAWLSRISIIFSLCNNWHILQWVLVILSKLNQKCVNRKWYIFL